MKKYKIVYLLIFIIFIIFINFNNVYGSLPLIGKLIIIDPGHGGVDPGTVYEDIYEKDINLEISKVLEEELIKLGATVILTRDDDYDLSSPGVTWRKMSDFDNRIKLINNSGADLYLSLHMNYLNNANYSGTGIFYNDNIKLAQIIQDSVNEYYNYNWTIKEIPKTTYMYSRLEITGVLIECGFLSNYNDRINFQDKDYQQKFSKIIAEALIKYF